jgi:hypothetical protein
MIQCSDLPAVRDPLAGLAISTIVNLARSIEDRGDVRVSARDSRQVASRLRVSANRPRPLADTRR